MKGLSQFVKFDWDSFANGKQFLVVGTSEYQDFESKQHLGTKVDCIITVDKTPYEFKDGKVFTNRFERVTFKVGKDISVPVDAYVLPKGVKASIYGEFRNQLSVKCDDLAVATPKGN